MTPRKNPIHLNGLSQFALAKLRTAIKPLLEKVGMILLDYQTEVWTTALQHDGKTAIITVEVSYIEDLSFDDDLE